MNVDLEQTKNNVYYKTCNKTYNERLKDIPKILETPYVGKNAPYKLEIEMIRNKKFDDKLKEKLEQ